MTKTGHILTGTVIGVMVGFNPIFSGIGSIIPDKDLIIDKLIKTRKKSLLFSHRGITHHFMLIPIFLFLSFYLKNQGQIEYLVSSVLFGYALHLITDTLTPLGIPYKLSYYPRFSFNLFKTGSIAEYMFIIFFVVFVALFVYLNPEILKNLSKNIWGR